VIKVSPMSPHPVDLPTDADPAENHDTKDNAAHSQHIEAGGTFSTTAHADDVGQRLDRVLTTRLASISRSRVQMLITQGQASVSGQIIGEAGYRVKPGDEISLVVPPPVPAEPSAELIELSIVYEDAALIVIDKPAGLVVHPAAGHETGTLVNALLAHCGDSLSGIGGVKRPGIVHRLDKDTSGLLVVAKSDAAHKGLCEQFAAHGRDGRMQRQYCALVWGQLAAGTGTIDAPLARSTLNRTKMAVVNRQPGLDPERERSREAITHYEVVEVFHSEVHGGRGGAPLASLVHLELETGRTHQIRVHLSHIGHPVIGDQTYGAHFRASERRLTAPAMAALRILGRQALHAAVLGFEHPITGQAMSFESALPEDMATLIAAMTPAATSAPVRRRTSRREK
jgi:23S rRNA pseudouridine1911/1915/1917 synthase